MLFDGVSFKVERRDRLALAGAERRRQDDAAAGARRRDLRSRAASWPGRRGRGSRCTTSDRRRRASVRCATTCCQGTADLAAVEEELRTLEQRDGRTATTRRRRSAGTASAQARLEHAGGYDWRDRAASVVRGLGFTDADLDRPLRTFSGGELTRASLARALASQPDMLLLDEPTNHLDIESLEWLEGMLKTIDAAVILVAHDRWFLEAVTTAVLELDNGRSTYFPGAWHVWRREQTARALHQAKTAARQAEQLARLERFVERFRAKASKAKQAQSKVKQIKRIEAERVETPDGHRRTLGFEFLKPARSGRDVLVVEELAAAGRRQAAARRGASSRSSAASTSRSSGRTAPARRRCSKRCSAAASRHRARVRIGHGVEPAYFSQHEAELDERGSVLDAAMSGHRAEAPRGAEAARALPLLRLGRAREAGRRALGRRAAAAGARDRRRFGCELARSSTSRRTISTSSRASRSRRRSKRFRAPSCSSRTTGRCSTPSRAGCSRSRRAGIVSYPGGWADYVRAQEAEAPAASAAGAEAREAEAPVEAEAERRSSSSRPRSRAPRRASPSSSGSSPTTGTTRRSSRPTATPASDLAALISRWEALFEASGSTTR